MCGVVCCVVCVVYGVWCVVLHANTGISLLLLLCSPLRLLLLLVERWTSVAGSDTSTSAVACRLKFALVVSDTPMWDTMVKFTAKSRRQNPTGPIGTGAWHPMPQMDRYLRCLGHVSGDCRLTHTEETLLLELCTFRKESLYIRYIQW